MRQRSVVERVESLERTVEALETLPARMSAVELQIVQLRDEMHDGFSEIRQDVRAADEALRNDLRAVRDELSARIAEGERAVRDELSARIAEGERAVRDELSARIAEGERVVRDELSARIAEGDEETRRYMRVLHEEVISRIATLREDHRPRKRR